MRKHAIFSYRCSDAGLSRLGKCTWKRGADAARSNGFYVSAANSFLPVRHLEPAW